MDSEERAIRNAMEDAGVTWAFMRQSKTRDLVVGCTGPNRSGFIKICSIPDDVVIERAIYLLQKESSERDKNISIAQRLKDEGQKRLNLGERLLEEAVRDKKNTEQSIYNMRLYLSDKDGIVDPKVIP